MAIHYWKKLSTNVILENRYVTVVEDEVELPNGHQTKYLRYPSLTDYVTVIAMRDNKIAMLKEYSYPHDDFLLQLPEGSIENGEDPEPAALRELQEEASLTATILTRIGRSTHDHRRSDTFQLVYVATGVTDAPKLQGDAEEIGTTVEWYSVADIKQMATYGTIVQRNTFAALMHFFSQQ